MAKTFDSKKFSNQFTLTRDGNIKFKPSGAIVGTYQKRDIWKESHALNGRDISGDKLVHYAWKFILNNGYVGDFFYTLTEMKEHIMAKFTLDCCISPG